MREFFAYDPAWYGSGGGFGMHSITHLTTIAVILAASVLISLFYRRLDETSRLKMVRIIMVIIVVLEIIQHVSFPVVHGFYVIEYMPFQLCGIMIFVAIFYSIKLNKTAGEILYAPGLAGFVAALFFPNWTEYPFINFYNLKSFTTHGLQIAFVLMLLVAGQVRPTPRSIWKSIAFLGAVGAPLYVLNYILGTNFLFLMYGPEGTPVKIFSDAFGSPLFLLPFAGLVVAVLVIMYLPWYFVEKRRK